MSIIDSCAAHVRTLFQSHNFQKLLPMKNDVSQPLTIPKYDNNLADFIGDMRSQVFKYKSDVARHTYTHHTTIGRYENPDIRVRPPIGYISYLAKKLFVQYKGSQLKTIVQDGILKEINRVIDFEYRFESPSIRNWNELEETADSYIEERRLKSLEQSEEQKPSNSAVQSVSHPFTFSSVMSCVFDTFKWEDADEHAKSSWAGILIWSIRVIMDRLTLEGFLNLCLILLIWISTAWLVSPILSWPLNDIDLRAIAAIKYSTASLIIPLCIGILTKPDPNEFKMDTKRHKIIILFLKITGSIVGFNGFAITLFILAAVGHYLNFSTFTPWFLWILVLMPLLFSHIGARRIPADRYKMFGSIPHMHDADLVFLGVFSFVGLFVAGFLYLEYDIISNPVTGIGVLIVFIFYALWKRRSIQRITESADNTTKD